MENNSELNLEALQSQIEKLEKKVKKLENNRKDQLSMAIVSGDMDKILAAMIISLAAAAMDTKVKLFFSFWALSALRDPKKHPKGKDFISKMFGMMLPKGKDQLKLSNMNMVGMGPSAVTMTHSAPRTVRSICTARATRRCIVSGSNTMSVSQNHSQSASEWLSRNSTTSRFLALARFAVASTAT